MIAREVEWALRSTGDNSVSVEWAFEKVEVVLSENYANRMWVELFISEHCHGIWVLCFQETFAEYSIPNYKNGIIKLKKDRNKSAIFAYRLANVKQSIFLKN